MNSFLSDLRAVGLLGLGCVVSACTSVMQDGARPQGAATVDRMYVIDCGANHAKDLSLWTTPADKGKPYEFSNNCYLIRKGAQWILWDSGNADRIASMPHGLVNPRGTLTAYMSKPLIQSLSEIGVAPEAVTHFAMSHSHGDHSGNAGLFAQSTIYMQSAEYDAVYGPDPQKLGIPPANFQNLRGARIVKLNGDHDVFGDGSVDFVHLKSNWEAKRAPSINYNVEQSVRSMNEMESFIKATGAQLWINHDSEQSRTIPKAPAFVE